MTPALALQMASSGINYRRRSPLPGWARRESYHCGLLALCSLPGPWPDSGSQLLPRDWPNVGGDAV